MNNSRRNELKQLIKNYKENKKLINKIEKSFIENNIVKLYIISEDGYYRTYKLPFHYALDIIDDLLENKNNIELIECSDKNYIIKNNSNSDLLTEVHIFI